MKTLIGKKCKILTNLEDHLGYEGQELEVVEELENDYLVVTDGKKTWYAGIEETNLV